MRKAGTHVTHVSHGRYTQGVTSPNWTQGSLAEAAPSVPGKRREPLGIQKRCAGGAHHGGLAPESLGALESRRSSEGLLVVHARVRGYDNTLKVLIDSGASKNFARRQTVAKNSDKLTDAMRESKGNGPVSVRLADGTVITVPKVQVDLAVKFEDFDSRERFIVLEMDKYDLILGMPWLEKHEPWIDWRGKSIGASRPMVSDRALVSNVPTSVRTRGYRQVRPDATASEEFLGAAGKASDSLRASAHSPAGRVPQSPRDNSCGAPAATPATTNVLGVPTGTRQVGNLGPHRAGNKVPHRVTQTVTGGEATECASSVRAKKAAHGAGNLVPHPVAQTKTAEESAQGASCVGTQIPHRAGNTVPHHVAQTETAERARKAPPVWLT